MKDFNNWNEKKIKIDSNETYKHPREREVWWCSIGVNVGTEIFGKGDDFARPVLIINASVGEGFIGVPLTSKIKNGEYFCIIKVKENKLSTALVHQVRNFDKRRLRKRIGCISRDEYKNVIQCFLKICKIS